MTFLVFTTEFPNNFRGTKPDLQTDVGFRCQFEVCSFWSLDYWCCFVWLLYFSIRLFFFFLKYSCTCCVTWTTAIVYMFRIKWGSTVWVINWTTSTDFPFSFCLYLTRLEHRCSICIQTVQISPISGEDVNPHDQKAHECLVHLFPCSFSQFFTKHLNYVHFPLEHAVLSGFHGDWREFTSEQWQIYKDLFMYTDICQSYLAVLIRW